MEITFDLAGDAVPVEPVPETHQAAETEEPAIMGMDVEDDPILVALRGNLKREVEEQVILRVPESLVPQFRSHFGGGSEAKIESMKFQMSNESKAAFRINGSQYTATLVDLPSIIETHRTYNNGKTMFKSADVSQMFVLNELGDKQSKMVAHDSGITPYTQGIKDHYIRSRVPYDLSEAEVVLDNINRNCEDTVERFELATEEIEVEIEEGADYPLEQEDQQQQAKQKPSTKQQKRGSKKQKKKAQQQEKKEEEKGQRTPQFAMTFDAAPVELNAMPSFPPSRISSGPHSTMAAASPPQLLGRPSPMMRDPLSEPEGQSFTVTLSAIAPAMQSSEQFPSISSSDSRHGFPSTTLPLEGRSAQFPSASPEVAASLGPSSDAMLPSEDTLMGFPPASSVSASSASSSTAAAVIAAASPPEDLLRDSASPQLDSSPPPYPDMLHLQQEQEQRQQQEQQQQPTITLSPLDVLKRKLEDLQAQLERAPNKIIQKRLAGQIAKLQSEIAEHS